MIFATASKWDLVVQGRRFITGFHVFNHGEEACSLNEGVQHP
jgi:hypothetical protein